MRYNNVKVVLYYINPVYKNIMRFSRKPAKNHSCYEIRKVPESNSGLAFGAQDFHLPVSGFL